MNTAIAPKRYDPRHRWGSLIEGGFCILPDTLLRNWHATTGLDATDLAIVGVISSYWWRAERLPYPSPARIGIAIGVSRRTVERRIKSMIRLGYLQRGRRIESSHGGPTCRELDLSGLIAKFGE